MKKNYFLSICLMLFMAVQATAQVASAKDLFGNYKFTADVEYVNEAYKSILPGECDAVIEADETYGGRIIGFAGSQVQQNFNINSSKIEATNLNSPQLWENLYLADANGNNPYGYNVNGEWIVEMYNTVYYTYDPAVKVISIPDFTVVEVTDYKAEKATVIARYTNVKMTFAGVSDVEVADISGEWIFKPGDGEYDTMQDSTIPTTFSITLAKSGDDNRAYNATFAIEGYSNVEMAATFDGEVLELAYDNLALDEAAGVYFAPVYGYEMSGVIGFDKVSETEFVLNNDNFCLIDSEGNYLQWYMAGSLKNAASVAPVDWTGVYNVTLKNPSTDIYVENAAGFEWPTDFQFEVVKYDDGTYYIANIFGLDVVGLNNYAGLEFVPAEDGKSVEISTGFLYMVQPGVAYLEIRDVNGSQGAIEMAVNEDGTMSVIGLSVLTVNYTTSTTVFNAMYSNLVVTRDGFEPETPETPVVPEDFDWAGEYVLTATVDNGNFQSTFDVTIIWDDSYPGYESYCITNFMGYDVTEINYGGIFLNTIDASTQAVDMYYNNLYMLEESVYLKMLDGNAGNTPIELTLNADGTISVSDFTVVHSGTNEQLAKYTNVVLTKNVESVEPETPVVPEDFDWAGEYILTSTVDNEYYQPTFDVTIIWDDSYPGYESYCITNFMGYDVTGINYGGIFLNTIDASTQAVDMYYNNLYMLEEGVYLKMLDGNAGNTPIELTLNADGTISVSDFTVVHSGTNEQLAKYTNVVLTKNADDTAIEEVKGENGKVKGVYDMQGRKVDAITAPGLYIVDGKKVLVK